MAINKSGAPLLTTLGVFIAMLVAIAFFDAQGSLPFVAPPPASHTTTNTTTKTNNSTVTQTKVMPGIQPSDRNVVIPTDQVNVAAEPKQQNAPGSQRIITQTKIINRTSTETQTRTVTPTTTPNPVLLGVTVGPLKVSVPPILPTGK